MNQNPRIAVIGDVFVDEYIYIERRKDNPETEGTVYNIKRKQYFPGGAAAVSMMCSSLGAKTSLYSVTGIQCGTLLNILSKASVSQRLIEDNFFKVTTKTRYVLEDILYPDRFDLEQITEISQGTADFFLMSLEKDNPDIILISDYGKGCITNYLLDNLPKKLIIADPAFGTSWGRYHKSSVIKANEKEAKEALKEVNCISHPVDYARILSDIYDRSVVVTLGERGLQYSYHNQTATTQQHTNGSIPAINCPDKKDICGAGDTIFAVLGTYLAIGYSLKEACEFAVKYATQQIQTFGIRPLRPIGDLEYVRDY